MFSWLIRLFGKSKKPTVPAISFPVDRELEPGLRVRIYHHEITTQIGTIICWTYISDGLVTYHQKELIFTLRCDTSEQPKWLFEKKSLEIAHEQSLSK